VKKLLLPKARAGILIALAWSSGWAASAAAQTCTVGPFTSSTPLSSVISAINGAKAGAVVCLQRGQTWTGSTGLNLTASFPATSRVTICSSDTSQCQDSGAANAKVSVTNGGGFGVRFRNGAGGYELRNIDFAGPADAGGSDTIGLQPDRGSHDVRFVGGKVSSWWHMMWSDSGSGSPATNIEFGTCAAPLEMTTAASGGSEPFQQGTYGSYKSTAWRLNLHDYSPHGLLSHFLDIAYTGSINFNDDNNNSTDLVIECSKFGPNALEGGEDFMKFSAGKRLTVRNNNFTGCNRLLGFTGHGPDGNTYGWDQVDIYQNTFDGRSCSSQTPVVLLDASNVRIYNNVVSVAKGNSQGGLVSMNCQEGSINAQDNDVAHVSVYNNTVYRNGSASDPTSGYGTFGSSDAGCVNGGTQPSDITVVNNLDMENDTQNPYPWQVGAAGCNAWGTNGAQVHNNFVYSPNKAPRLPSCSASDMFAKSGSTTTATGDGWNTPPGVTDLANFNFTITNASKVFGQGDPKYCPATDFAGNARPSTCSIGAYDVGSGSPAALQPPTLIQASPLN